MHAGRRRVEIDLREVVDRVEQHVAEWQQRGGRQSLGPGAMIVVAAYGGQRRDRRQCLEDRRIADVAGMHDVIGAAHKVERLRTEQAVRVRNQGDAHASPGSSRVVGRRGLPVAASPRCLAQGLTPTNSTLSVRPAFGAVT